MAKNDGSGLIIIGCVILSPVFAVSYFLQIDFWMAFLVVAISITLIVVIYKCRRQQKFESKKTELLRTYPEEEALDILNRRIWKGMSREQLIKSWGKPEAIDKTLTASSKTREVFKYNQDGKNRYRNRVFLINDIVSSWKSRED